MQGMTSPFWSIQDSGFFLKLTSNLQGFCFLVVNFAIAILFLICNNAANAMPTPTTTARTTIVIVVLELIEIGEGEFDDAEGVGVGVEVGAGFGAKVVTASIR